MKEADNFLKPFQIDWDDIYHVGSLKSVNCIPELSAQILRLKRALFNLLSVVAKEAKNEALNKFSHIFSLLVIIEGNSLPNESFGLGEYGKQAKSKH